MNAILATIIPLVSEEIGKLLKDEVESLQKQYPGSTPFEAVEKAIANLLSKSKLPQELAQKLNLSALIAKISHFNANLVKAVFENPALKTLGDFAIQFDTAAIRKVVGNEFRHLADAVRTEVFKAAPMATVEGMVRNDKIPLISSDPAVKQDLVNVLQKLKSNPTSPVPLAVVAAKDPEVAKAVAPERLAAVRNELKTISRVHALSPTTKSMEHLMNKGLTTSSLIAQIPKADFVADAAEAITVPVAETVHAKAVETVFQNENLLLQILQMFQGTGLNVIDGPDPVATRKSAIQGQLSQQGLELNIENLFGSMDQCICDDCTTVYSAASYYVDLLNFLRNNNLDPLKPNLNNSVAGQPDAVDGTVLGKLLRRRPDLGNLQLTCENTNTVLPYIDLANEVMESFIVNLDSFSIDAKSGPQAMIDVFNVGTEDSSELLSEPHNVNYAAYCTLSTSVYPFTLPYHLPLSAAREFLKFLKVQRSDLLDAARHRPPVIKPNSTVTAVDLQTQLHDLQKTALDRQVTAELLGLTQEDYIILTKEAFFRDSWFNVTENINPGLTVDEYRCRIGVRDLAAYWGYSDLPSLLGTSDDPDLEFTGLQSVKAQLLPRSGISWIELTQIVQTTFINPLLPRGRDKKVFDDLKFSYRFLQSLVDTRQSDPRRRLGKLAEFLVQASKVISIAELLWVDSSATSSDPSGGPGTNGMSTANGTKHTKRSPNGCCCVDDDEVRDWVFDNFESMGGLVVLDFNEGPYLDNGNSGELKGYIFAAPLEGPTPPPIPPPGLTLFPNGAIGSLSSNGQITDPAGIVFATVSYKGAVLLGSALTGKTLSDAFPRYSFDVRDSAGTTIAIIRDGYLKVLTIDSSGNGVDAPVSWALNENMGSGCNIDNVRIQHLDGTPLGIDEWDKMHRFIRLWKKLGWSMGETDRAVIGLSNPALCDDSDPSAGGPTAPASTGAKKKPDFVPNDVTNVVNGDIDNILITFDDYTSSKYSSGKGSGSGCGSGGNGSKTWQPDITSCLMEQLAAMSQSLPLAGLSVEQLLCFWTDIPTIATGDASNTKSLYEKLFFTANLKSSDPVFGADANGDYFTGPAAKITDNLAAVMAAFKVKADDIRFLLGLTHDAFSVRNPDPIPDVLNITNLSKIYRIALLARVLGIQIYDVYRAISGLGNPFDSATNLYNMLWWWNIAAKVPFAWEDLRYVVDEVPTPTDPQTPDPKSVLATAKTLNDGIEQIKATYVVPVNALVDATDDIVKARLSLVMQDASVDKIRGLLNGTAQYAARTTKVPDSIAPAFIKAVQEVFPDGKVSYIPPVGDGSAQVQIMGILTHDEMENAKGLGDELASMAKADQGKTATVPKGAVRVKAAKVTKVQQNGKQMQADWDDALDRASKLPINIFVDLMKGIFDDTTFKLEMDPTTATILAGDLDENDNTQPRPQGQKPSDKRFFFLRTFIPFLQRKLARTLVSDTVTSAVGFNDRVVAGTILENVSVRKSDPTITLDFLLEILKPSHEDPKNFSGYLSVPNSDSYAFIITADDQPAAIDLDGNALEFTKYQDDPKRIWITDPTKADLKAGKLYELHLHGVDMTTLEWKPSSSSRSAIPSSSFFPEIALSQTVPVFDRLKKTAILINHFKLSSDEVIYICQHPQDFDSMQFNTLSMTQWKRIQAYTAFRDSLPAKTTMTLIDLFKWSSQNPSVKGNTLAQNIASATMWKPEDITDILSRANFSKDGAAVDFKNEVVLVKMARIITLAQKLQVDVPRLFHWSSPLGTSTENFYKLRDVAEDIKKVARSRFDLSSWEAAVRPLSDTLREQQKNALIAFLLVQDEVRKAGVTDADSLFEFFLIDVQMTPLVETSRIKQAIATVQVYIQRCLLGLEEKNGVSPDRLSKDRWDWMSRYRLWEANRKIFLYPENWIDPTLRDDKSDFFVKLEGELLQKDVSPDIVAGAVRGFLYSVNEVANMEMVAICVEQLTLPLFSAGTPTHSAKTESSNKATTNTSAADTPLPTTPANHVPSSSDTTQVNNTKLHLFARTSVSPYSYYYISYSNGTWTAWSKMDIEIPHFTTVGQNGQDGITGNYMAPIVHNGRLLVFIPQILKRTMPKPKTNSIVLNQTATNLTPSGLAADERWEVKMSYTEFRNGKWIQRQLCPEGTLAKKASSDASSDLPIEGFTFAAAELLVADPTSSSKPGDPIPAVALGVRVFAGVITMEDQQNNKSTMTLDTFAEWDFIDGQLHLQTGDAPSFTRTVTEAPIIFTTSFQYKKPSSSTATTDGTTKAPKLYPMQAIDKRSLFATDPKNIQFTDATNFDAMFGLPFVTKGQIASTTNAGVLADSKAILTRVDDSTSQVATKNQLLYHKFIHDMMAVSVETVKAGDAMPLSPLYSYLGGLSRTPPKAGPTPVVTPANGKANKDPLPITDQVPAISDVDEAFGGIVDSKTNKGTGEFNERSTPYSIYNWEIGLHAPMVLIDRLLKAQKFDAALNVCHYVFNPLAQGKKDDMRKYWVFTPFKAITTQTIEQRFMGYKAGKFRQDVSDWRDSPFQPHVVARSRPQAYMMWIVMKYIEILIAYGDYYFRQNTLETIPDAIQMYILASHLYGPRGQKIPRPKPQRKYTYNELATRFDAFSNAMVKFEEVFPISNQTPLPVVKLSADSTVALANIFGFAGTLVFAIPDNPNLRALGDTIDDRLFKIRHSQDINGVFRELPLFEPPIDPALLVQAAAQGLSISSVLQDLNGPMPNYRFQYLLAKALELAQEVKSFGAALLTTREKLDFETLSLLRAKHETVTQTTVMELKKLALDEANKTLESLQYSRKAPVNRLRFYLQLVGQDLTGIPDVDNEFQELVAQIEKPVEIGGLMLNSSERQEMDQYASAANLSVGVAAMEIAAAIANIIPNTSGNFEPLGCGMSVTFGGQNIGSQYSAIARGLQMGVSQADYMAATAGRKSQAIRTLQERILQANMAGYEISNIDKQVTTSKIRVAMANKDIELQQKQIDQAHEVEDFLQQKYSNAGLYSWLEGATRSLFYDSYTQAYDLAKKAEKAFQFERPALASASFIQPGYWDPGRDGLLAGEKLYNALKLLESKYIESRGYDYEVTKNISLRQLDPMQLISVRETGACTIDIPEVLFDMDFPGHYNRRLKSVSVSVPCLLGPYASINSTLRLKSHKIRVSSANPTGTAYREVIDPSSGLDSRFSTSNIPINAIAVCSGQNDSGVFELNFQNDRYMPFEGAGAISSWSFTLPQHNDTKFRQFRWESITDIIVSLRYTSIEGGSQLQQGASDSVASYLEEIDFLSTTGGLWSLFDLKNEFATSWTRMVSDSSAAAAAAAAAAASSGVNGAGPAPKVADIFLDVPALDEKMPVFASPASGRSLVANEIWVLSDVAFPGGDIGLTADGKDEGKLALQTEGQYKLTTYQLKGADVPVSSWKLKLGGGSGTPGKVATKRAWLLFRYTVK